ncbi:MAG: hypothetical protein Fur0012_03940 [Elusimicrobiota bacterium]
MLRSNPHLIEINTRLWLKNLREKYSSPEMTISAIPDEEWLNLKHLGFDIIWLIGVWQCGKMSTEIAKNDAGLIEEAVRLGYDKEKICCSPYSILEYKLDESLGFEWELRALKDKLNSMGLKLFLDFVSNHAAIDRAYDDECINCLVLGDEEEYKRNPKMFHVREKDGKKIYVAYGKDPNFPSWYDTVQLNYFNPITREKMKNEFLKLLELCDGARCDMVMLTLNDVHESAWGWLLSKQGFSKPQTEFWQEVISQAKQLRPDFVFLAEVYWGLEWKLQQMGFDYTYDKVIYDRLKTMGADEIRGHLRAERLYQKRSARFIDNHDENPSVSSMGKNKAMAAAVIISTIRGLRFYNDMQLKGSAVRVPLQFAQFDADSLRNVEMEKFYERLLLTVDHPAFHGGEWNLCEPLPMNPEDKSYRNFIAFTWIQRRTMKIVAVNYSQETSSCLLKVSVKAKGDSAVIFEEISDRFFSFKVEKLESGLPLENVPPYGFFIFDCEL